MRHARIALLLSALIPLLPAVARAQQTPSALDPFETWGDGFADVRGIVVDAAGNVFVADREAGTVTRIAPDRTKAIVAGGLERPIGLAFDAAGRLLIAEERAGRVVRVEANGTRTPVVAGVKQPRWLAVGEDGALYATARRLTRDTDPEPDDESAEPEVILALSPAGALSVFSDGYKRLQGLAVDHEALFATTQGRRDDARVDGVIFRIPILPGGATGTPAQYGPNDEFKKPIGLARDRLGALYLTTKELTLDEDRSKRVIAKLHPDGHVTLYAESLAKPHGLAFDADGNLYLADGGRVLRFRSPSAPALTVPGFTNQSPLAVTGTTQAGARVDVFVNDASTPVSVVAGADGQFSASVALALGAASSLQVFATTHGGAGLTSPPAEATVVHDAAAPSLAFQAPPAGAYVRQSVSVEAQASDTSSGVASLTLTVDGQPLGAALAPPPPAPSVAAAATWDTASVADGAHTLGAVAVDRAGNSASASRPVIVDNTPPDTRITAGPRGEPRDTSATFAFTGTDNLTPVASLAFAWRLDGGAFSAWSPATTATFTGLAEGAHSFEVKSRDLAGNEDATPAARTFTVSLAPTITAVDPASGTIGAFVTITGTRFDLGGARVSFNGVPAVLRTVSATTITTTAPIGATTGPLTVSTVKGTASIAFTVTLTGDFTLAASPAAPATLRVIAGDEGFAVIRAGGSGSFTSLVSLGVSPDVPGITASFSPQLVAPGAASFLGLAVAASVAPGTYAFTVSGQAQVDAQTVTRTTRVTLEVLPPDTPAVTGRILTAESVPQPIPGVTVVLGSAFVLTDAAGNFVLQAAPPGPNMLFIDGRTASTPDAQFPIVEVQIAVAPSGPSRVPFTLYLPKLDTANAVTLPLDAAGAVTQDTTVTTPRLPGLEIHIPAGTTITGPDGNPVSQIVVTPVPIDRSPMPFPPGVTPTMLFAIHPGGAVPSQPLAITFPNTTRAGAGAKARMNYFDLTIGAWNVWGTGTVTADGSQIASDPGFGLPRFAWHFPDAPFDDADEEGAVHDEHGGEPVDLVIGRFVVNKTDMVLPARIPLTVQRAYKSGSSRPGLFGLGWHLAPYDSRLRQSGVSLLLVLPDRSSYRFTPAGPDRWTNTTEPFLLGAVITQVAPRVYALRFKTGLVHRFEPLLGVSNASGLVAITDRNGNTVTLTRETVGTARDRITRLTEPAGRVISFAYDGQGRITSLTDPIGRVVGYAYDALGRLETVTDAAGGVTRYAYDASHRILAITDARGITFITNEYDATGRVVRQVQADGGVWGFAYTLAGQVVTQTVITNPRGHATVHRFNNQGLVLSRTDALGQTTTYAYQAGTNALTSTTDALGRTSTVSYDAVGNPVSTTTPNDRTMTMAYEPVFNRLTRITDALYRPVRRFEYDAAGNLTASIDPSGARTVTVYDAFGQPLTTTDALGNTWRFTYDAQGNVVAITDPAGGTTRRVYDPVGRVMQKTDARGRSSTFVYDALDGLVQVVDAQNGTTSYIYDPNSNLLTTLEPRGGTIVRTYDVMDRLASRTDQLGQTESFEYDPSGNLTRHVDRNGQVHTSAYDPLNRRIEARYADGTVTRIAYTVSGLVERVSDSVGGTIVNEYDPQDRLAAQTMPLGRIAYAYDVLSRRTRMEVPGLAPIAYAYDENSRLTEITHDAQTIALSYDVIGRRTGLSLPNGIAASYQYDAASRLIALTYQSPGGTLGDITYTYDADGNRTRVGGSLATTLLPDAVDTATYDGTGRQLVFGDKQMTFDGNGNVVTLTDPSGTTRFDWDARNRLLAISAHALDAAFTYDALGRRLSTRVNGSATDFLYDQGDVVLDLMSGIPTGYLRGPAGDELFVIARPTGRLIALPDGLGSVLRLRDDGAATLVSYSYGPFGTTQASNASVANAFQFTGRENDGTGLYYYRARYYSPALHRFLSPDPVRRLSGATYTYADNNPTTYIDPLGLLTLALQGGLASSQPGGSSASSSGGLSQINQLVVALEAAGEVVLPLAPDDVQLAIALAENAALDGETINIVGFSRGGASAVDVSWALADRGVPVNVLATIDSFGSDHTIPPNVSLNLNFSGKNPFTGGKNQPADGDRTTVRNIEVSKGHQEIPREQEVIDTITDAIRPPGGRK